MSLVVRRGPYLRRPTHDAQSEGGQGEESDGDTNPSAPAYEVEFARIGKATPKLVFSKTLDHVDGNSRLVRGDIADEVTKLKAEPGKNLAVGGANLASTFLRLGLIDEYRVFVHPVVLGGGTPFFPALENRVTLRLVETRTFGSGVVYLRRERVA